MNILNILKDKPKGTKLYSPICGECELLATFSTNEIRVTNSNFYYNFNKEGKYAVSGECLLFPSNEMRDWNKFAWKKGDVLVNKDGINILFSHWLDDTYTTFAGKDKMNTVSKITTRYHTIEWMLATDYNKNNFINDVEKTYNGKLNLETLEIEKKDHVFKPFEKVLGRDADYDAWNADFFEYLAKDTTHPYRCIKSMWRQCIPYEGNEHLLNTIDNPTE